MGAWLEAYRQRIQAASARGAATRSQSGFDLANAVVLASSRTQKLSRPDDAEDEQWNRYNIFEKAIHSDFIKNILTAEPVANTIDVLSRPNYALASMFEETARQDREAQESGQAKNFWEYDKAKALGAAVEGFEGQSKKTFSDVLAVTNPDTMPNEDSASDWGRALGGFGLDVALDPTTYIGLGPVAQLLKGKVPHVVKNTAKEVPVVEPGLKGATNPAPAFAKTVAEKVEPPKAPSKREVAALQKAQAMQLASDLEMQKFADAIKGGIKSTRYSSETNVPVPFAQGTKSVTKQVPKEIEETLPGPTIKGQAERNTITRLINENPEQYGMKITEDGNFAWAGTDEIIDEDTWYKGIDELQKLGNWKKGSVTVYKADGTTTKIPASKYARSLETGKGIGDEFSIDKGSEIVPLKDYSSKKFAKYEANEIGGGQKVKKQIIEDVTEEIPIWTRLGKAEKDAWRAEVSKVLDPEDAAYLAKAGSKESFDKRLQEVLAKTDEDTGFSSFDDFTKAVKEKRISPEEAKRVALTMGYKTTHTATRGWEAAVKRSEAALDQKTAATSKKLNADDLAKETDPWATRPAQGSVSKTGPYTEKIPITGKMDLHEIEQAKKHNALVDANLNPVEAAKQVPGVKPAEQILEEAKVGNLENVAPKKFDVALTPVEQEATARILQHVMGREFLDPKNKKLYPYKTNKGVKRTSSIPGKGVAREVGGFNRMSSIALHKAAIDETRKIVGKTGQKDLVYEHYMRFIKASEDVLRSKGIEPILGQGASNLPLSLHDLLSVLPRATVERYVADYGKNIPVQHLLEAAEISLQHAAGKIDKAAAHKAISEVILKPMSRTGTPNMFTSTVLKSPRKMANSEIYRVTAKLLNAGPDIAQRVNDNAARVGIQQGKYVERLRHEVIDDAEKFLIENFDNPTKLLAAVQDLPTFLDNGVKTLGQTPPVGAVEQVSNELIHSVSKALPMAEMKQILHFAEMGAKTPNKPAVIAKQFGETLGDVRQTQRIFDIGEDLAMAQFVQYSRGLFPHIGNNHIRTKMLGYQAAARYLAAQPTNLLSNLAKKYTKDEIHQAWKYIQNGTTKIPDTRMQEAIKDIEVAAQYAFDTTPGGPGIVARNNIQVKHLNSKLKHYGVPDRFKLSGDSYDEALQSWRKWENVEDPLQLFSKYFAAIQSTHSENLLGAGITRVWGKPTKSPGYVKIVDSSNKSIVGSLIDKTQYYPEDIAKEMLVLDKSLKDLRKTPSTSDFWRATDNIIHSYKTQLTIYRPGHHMRNVLGDIWLGNMDGMWSPSYYRDSMRILASRKHMYKDFNPDLSLTKSGEGRKYASFSYNGKKVELNADDMYRLAAKHGVLRDYVSVEDLGVAGGKIDSLSEWGKAHSPFKGGIHRRAATVSEVRDHWIMMAHFKYALEKGPKTLQGKTLDDALDNVAEVASARARKFHPDGSDFSEFEKKGMRRVFMFYSWIRKAIPLVVQSAALKPGRFLVYPKAMYAYAQARGIDLNGFGDPFPTDQLFPDWMDESALGPHEENSKGEYFGYKSGIPGTDVLDQYFTNPATTMGTLFSATSPVFQIPYEMKTGTEVKTGEDIPSMTDYIVSQIPHAKTIRDVAGIDPEYTAKSNKGYEPQFDVPGIGTTLNSQGIAAANWLTGLGITDMSKPSYQVGAQLELNKKNKRDDPTRGNK